MRRRGSGRKKNPTHLEIGDSLPSARVNGIELAAGIERFRFDERGKVNVDFSHIVHSLARIAGGPWRGNVGLDQVEDGGREVASDMLRDRLECHVAEKFHRLSEESHGELKWNAGTNGKGDHDWDHDPRFVETLKWHEDEDDEEEAREGSASTFSRDFIKALQLSNLAKSSYIKSSKYKCSKRLTENWRFLLEYQRVRDTSVAERERAR